MKNSFSKILALGVLAVAAAAGSAHGQGSSGPYAGSDVASKFGGRQIASLIPYFGYEMPDWMKRFEVDWNFFDTNKPENSILTVQPLYQSGDKQDTLFVQGSLFHYALYGDYRWTGNIGLGYRKLLAHNTVMLGANVFYDNEFTNDHQRMSGGAEAKWGPLDFHFNNYVALSDDKSVSGFIEKALSGRDFTLKTQVPYLPWMKIGGGYFWWDAGQTSRDMNGSSFSAEFALHPNFSLDYKWSSYDVSNNSDRDENAVFLRFHLARLDSPTLTTGPVVADRAFERRDLSGETLKKVVRENRIIVERRATSGSVIIARGN
jgi:adhesin/invasin